MNSEKPSTDTAIEVFSYHCSSCVPLSDVHGYYLLFDDAPPMLVKIRLSFGDKFIFMSAAEDDSLSVDSGSDFRDLLRHEVRHFNTLLPWKTAISRPLLWGWVMINQQGYFDGVQLDFSVSAESGVTRIQIISIAGELKMQRSAYL